MLCRMQPRHGTFPLVGIEMRLWAFAQGASAEDAESDAASGETRATDTAVKIAAKAQRNVTAPPIEAAGAPAAAPAVGTVTGVVLGDD